jgi:hypothetical protein
MCIMNVQADLDEERSVAGWAVGKWSAGGAEECVTSMVCGGGGMHRRRIRFLKSFQGPSQKLGLCQLFGNTSSAYHSILLGFGVMGS